MAKVLALALLIFTGATFLFWKALHVYYKNEFGKKTWKLGGGRVYFWQSALFVGTATTFLTMYILKWTHVLTF